MAGLYSILSRLCDAAPLPLAIEPTERGIEFGPRGCYPRMVDGRIVRDASGSYSVQLSELAQHVYGPIATD